MRKMKRTVAAALALAASQVLNNAIAADLGGYQSKGFLSDYSHLKPRGGGSDAFIYENPKVDNLRYKRLMIDRVKVFLKEDASGDDLVLKLSYDVREPGSFGWYKSYLTCPDEPDFEYIYDEDHLSFWVKGAEGGEDFYIIIKGEEAIPAKEIHFPDDLAHLPGDFTVTQEWKQMNILIQSNILILLVKFLIMMQ